PNLIGGGGLLLVMYVFYLGHLKMEGSGPFWGFASFSAWLIGYLVFFATQLLTVFFVQLVDRRLALFKDLPPFFLGAPGFLIILPCYRIGYYNDLRLQASTPALLIAALATATCLTSEGFSLKHLSCFLLTLSFGLGGLYPAGRPLLNLAGNKKRYTYQLAVSD